MKLRFFIVLFIAVVCTQVLGEDYSWVESDELKMELNARQNDLERTEQRIKELQAQLVAQQNEGANINASLETVEQRLVQRTSMLYRLSKNGKSVQYLFSSDSMTSFVKRMQTLRLLVTSQMDEKRELSLQLARVDDDMRRTRDDIRNAEQLVTQLNFVVQNLKSELSRRHGRTAFR